MEPNTKQALLQYLSKWGKYSHTPTDDDEYRISDSVAWIYDRLGLDCPRIVVCKGPLEQIIFPILVGQMIEHDASPSEFTKGAIDSDLVRKGWESLWSDALRHAQKVSTLPRTQERKKNPCRAGALLNARIEKEFERAFAYGLMASVDEALEIEQHQELESMMRRQMGAIHMIPRRALMPSGEAIRGAWQNYVFRLPEEWRADLGKTSPKQLRWCLLRTRRDGGTTINHWLGAWDWT